MDFTPNLNLPYILSGQSQKYLSYNEAIGLLDRLCQLSCISATTQTPPTAPQEGKAYLIPDSATDLWAGQSQNIALWQSENWTYLPPKSGWLAYIEDENNFYHHDGTQWVQLNISNTVLNFGINTTTDDYNLSLIHI